MKGTRAQKDRTEIEPKRAETKRTGSSQIGNEPDRVVTTEFDRDEPNRKVTTRKEPEPTRLDRYYTKLTKVNRIEPKLNEPR